MTENGVISAPIGVSDVGKTIGSGSTDVGTLCTHPNINIWARYKPVSYPKITVRRVGSSEEGYDAVFNAMTGLDFYNMSDDLMGVSQRNDDVCIKHAKPTGGASSPYRITDFVEYDHKAQAPISTEWTKAFYINQALNASINIYDRSSDEERKWISFDDVIKDINKTDSLAMADMRLCMAVFKVTNTAETPVHFFFSEKYGNGQSKWDVSTINPYLFLDPGNVGSTYKFVIMLCENFSALEDGEDNMSAEEMADYWENVNAWSLCWGGNVEDRKVLNLLDDWHKTEIVYQIYGSAAQIEREGSIQSGNNVSKLLCLRVMIPELLVGSDYTLNSSTQFRLKMRWRQGDSQADVFAYTDANGNDYFGISTEHLTSLTMPITNWVNVTSANTTIDGKDNTYYLDFPSNEFILVDKDMPQTEGVNSGIFIYFDWTAADEAGEDIVSIALDLYYRENTTSEEHLVRTMNIDVPVAFGSGIIGDGENI